MPCGLAYWSDNSISVVIPGALVSTQYASEGWPLSFAKDSASGSWNMVKVPDGFPTTYTVGPDTAPAPAAGNGS
jgi:hypothetical protein